MNFRWGKDILTLVTMDSRGCACSELLDKKTFNMAYENINEHFFVLAGDNVHLQKNKNIDGITIKNLKLEDGELVEIELSLFPSHY